MQNGDSNNRFQGRLAGLVDPADSHVVVGGLDAEW